MGVFYFVFFGDTTVLLSGFSFSAFFFSPAEIFVFEADPPVPWANVDLHPQRCTSASFSHPLQGVWKTNRWPLLLVAFAEKPRFCFFLSFQLGFPFEAFPDTLAAPRTIRTPTPHKVLRGRPVRFFSRRFFNLLVMPVMFPF